MPVFQCPKCQNSLQLPDQMAGKMFNCPRCGQQLVIPSASQPAPPPAGYQAGPPQAAPRPQAPPQGYQQGPPAGYQQGPPAGYQAGLPPEAARGRGGPPAGEAPRRRKDWQEQEVGTIAATSAGSAGSKPLLFGLMGALGCFAAALLICGPHILLLPGAGAGEKRTETPPVDVMFVLDVTGSMEFAIRDVQNGIKDFVDKFKSEKLDVNVGLTVFRDELFRQPNDHAAGITGDPFTFKFGGKDFTGDPEEFKAVISRVKAEAGNDIPENSLEALKMASEAKIRDKALRVLILITDAVPKTRGGEAMDTALKGTKDEMKKRGVRQLHLIIGEPEPPFGAGGDLKWCYEQLWDKGTDPAKDAKALAGQYYDLRKIARERTGFNDVLNQFRTSILEEARRVGSTTGVGEFEKSQAWRLWIATSLLFAFLAFGLALALIMGQRLYMRQSLFDGGAIAKALFTLLAGLVSGFLVELIFTSIEGMPLAVAIILRTFAWTIVGAVIGLSMALFVPNLKWYKGLLGGVIGGFAGGLLFSIIATIFAGLGVVGTLLGDFLGAIILGFCVGVMVALAEVAFRRWWLEVRYGARETRTVTLGTAPVTVGSDERRATVVVRDVPALVMRYRLDQERIVCEDLESGRRMELEPGDSRRIGNVTITVCSPETVSRTGIMLELSNGQKVPLSDGLPLTADDLPGLQSNSPDGTVALVGKKPADPSILLLRNRSKQSWTVFERNGGSRAIDPGLGLQIEPGVEINFGRVQGRLIMAGGQRRR